jgi:hypothetical protein
MFLAILGCVRFANYLQTRKAGGRGERAEICDNHCRRRDMQNFCDRDVAEIETVGWKLYCLFTATAAVD